MVGSEEHLCYSRLWYSCIIFLLFDAFMPALLFYIIFTCKNLTANNSGNILLSWKCASVFLIFVKIWSPVFTFYFWLKNLWRNNENMFWVLLEIAFQPVLFGFVLKKLFNKMHSFPPMCRDFYYLSRIRKITEYKG